MFKPTTDGVWQSDAWCKWPGGNMNARYYAYAPIVDGLTPSPKDKPGVPEVTYTVPYYPLDQPDLIVTSLDEIAGMPSVVPNLEFEHALSAVRFSVANDGLLPSGYIRNITISGIYTSGTREMTKGGKWTYPEETASYSCNCNIPIGPSTDENRDILSGAATLMMIPQTVKNATIKVTYEEKFTGKQVILSAPVEKLEWKAGTTINYQISSSRIQVTHHILFGKQLTNIDVYPGDASDGSVKCYIGSFSRSIVDGTEYTYKDQSFILEYVEENSDGTYDVIEPDWIEKNNQVWDVSSSTVAFRFDKQTSVPGRGITLAITKPFTPGVNEHDVKLSQLPFRNEVINLADDGDGKETTANCYVVNEPGNYKFPLYIGNGLKHGEINTKALKGDNNTDFLGYDGKVITNPKIEGATGAKLIWQDVKDMITDVALDENHEYIIFKVNQGLIAQGNALIAVTNAAGDIMWSWHIWTTDFNPYDLSNMSGFMRQPIGWCDIAPYTNYDPVNPRSVKLRISQPNTGFSRVVTISQNTNMRGIGNCTLYQWSRKDPFMGGMYDTAKNGYGIKPCYDANGQSYALQSETCSDLSNIVPGFIKRPYSFVSSNYFVKGTEKPGDPHLWSAEYKTIYDPSPKGYRIATTNALQNQQYSGSYISYYGCYLQKYDQLFIPSILYISSVSTSTARPSVTRNSCFWSPTYYSSTVSTTSLYAKQIVMNASATRVSTTNAAAHQALGILCITE